jgi:thiol:disulfide interchange protein DsbA
LIARLLVVFTALAWMGGASATDAVAGRDYEVIKPAQPTESGSKVEVIEFFSYGCPHCAALQPALRNWLKHKPADVDFKRQPVVFQDSWVPFARLYYTLDAMGIVDKLHHDVFVAIHEQKIRLQDPETLFGWVASKGVDRKKFSDTYNSFTVQSRASRTTDVIRRYDIQFTPAIVVDGRYLTAPSIWARSSNSTDLSGYFQSVDQVIALARKNRRGK